MRTQVFSVDVTVPIDSPMDPEEFRRYLQLRIDRQGKGEPAMQIGFIHEKTPPAPIEVIPGLRYKHRLPYSEFAMHYGIAGEVREIEVLKVDNYGVHVFSPTGGYITGTIGEVGVRRESDGKLTIPPIDPTFDKAATDADMRRFAHNLNEIFEQAGGRTITDLGISWGPPKGG